MKTIIVDDEPLALSFIRSILAEIPEIELVAECSNGRDAITSILTNDAELVFLDIQMPEMNGFDVIKSLQADIFPMIVFTTAFSQYAVDAFDVHAIDYLLKPIDETKVKRAVAKAIAQRQIISPGNIVKEDFLSALEKISARVEADIALSNEAEGLPAEQSDAAIAIAVKSSGKIVMVLKNDIDWVEAAGDYICLHANGIAHLMRETMKDIEARLDADKFKRVHRSTIINITRVKEIIPHKKGEAFVRLGGEQLVKVSRNHRNVIKELIDHTE